MKDAMILVFRLLAVITRLLQPGGGRTIVAENLLLKQQLLLHSRSRSRAPNLSTLDRVLPGFWTLFLDPGRITRVGTIVQAGTLLKFHDALKQRKYRLLYSCKKQTGPKGPSREVIGAIVAIKERNPRFSCPRITQQMNLAFGLDLDKDVVRRILAASWRSTTAPNKERPDRHGSPRSITRK
jgi:putative transposase